MDRYINPPNDCPWCGEDDTDIPSLQDVCDEIITKRSYRLFSERQHKLTFIKDGSIKPMEVAEGITALLASSRRAREFVRVMEDRLMFWRGKDEKD